MLSRIGLLLAMVFLTGCLFTVDSDHSSGASAWSDRQVAAIREGETSQDWVRTRFGDPDRRSMNDRDGTEIWHYESVQKRETEVGLFLIFSIDVDDEVYKRLSIVFKDGVVEDYWTESDRA